MTTQTMKLASNLYAVWADTYYNHSEFITSWANLTNATRETWEAVAVQAEALIAQGQKGKSDAIPASAPSRRRGTSRKSVAPEVPPGIVGADVATQ